MTPKATPSDVGRPPRSSSTPTQGPPRAHTLGLCKNFGDDDDDDDLSPIAGGGGAPPPPGAGTVPWGLAEVVAGTLLLLPILWWGFWSDDDDDDDATAVAEEGCCLRVFFRRTTEVSSCLEGRGILLETLPPCGLLVSVCENCRERHAVLELEALVINSAPSRGCT